MSVDPEFYCASGKPTFVAKLTISFLMNICGFWLMNMTTFNMTTVKWSDWQYVGNSFLKWSVTCQQLNDFDFRFRIVKMVNPCNLNGGDPIELSDWLRWSWRAVTSLIGWTGVSWTVVLSIEIEFRLNSRAIGSSVRLRIDVALELNARWGAS